MKSDKPSSTSPISAKMVSPGTHTTVEVDRIPGCDFCELEGIENPGPYDFKTYMGPWAHGCKGHWREFGQYDTLGTGKGQLWVLCGSKPTDS